jgi:hypothetical protein
MHGAHHGELYERMLDPDTADQHGVWAGDIEYGTIRFYDNVRYINDREDIFDSVLFQQVMGIVKSLSEDFEPEGIGIDFQKHAFEDSEMRWFYKPSTGLTVWRTTTGWANYHDEMATRLWGPNYYSDEGYTGGYIYPDGRVKQTYMAYTGDVKKDAKINHDGYNAAANWQKNHTQISMDPVMTPRDTETYSFVVGSFGPDSMYKWSYPMGGPLNIWSVDKSGHPSHADVVPDFNAWEAQGHVYIDNDQPSLYVHRDRPYIPFSVSHGDEEGHAKYLKAKADLQEEAIGVVKQWVYEELGGNADLEKRDRQFDNMADSGSKWWPPKTTVKRPTKHKRHHVRKHHAPWGFNLGERVFIFPGFGMAAYPEGGQVDTTES